MEPEQLDEMYNKIENLLNDKIALFQKEFQKAKEKKIAELKDKGKNPENIDVKKSLNELIKIDEQNNITIL